MRFFSSLSLALAASAIATPLQVRGITVGALDTRLATTNATITQNLAITSLAISQAQAEAASEIVLLQEMTAGLNQTAFDLTFAGAAIAATLANAGIALLAPAIAYLNQALQQAYNLVLSTYITFTAQAALAASVFTGNTNATIAAEYAAAEAALSPFIVPLIAYAQAVQADGSSSASANLVGLKATTIGAVALVASINDLLGVSTD